MDPGGSSSAEAAGLSWWCWEPSEHLQRAGGWWGGLNRAECLGAERRKGPRSLNRRCGSQPGRGGVGPREARVGSPDEVQLGGRPARRGCSDKWPYAAWLQPRKCIPVVLKTRSTKGRCWQGHGLPEVPGSVLPRLFCFLAASGFLGPWQHHAGLCL